MRKDLRAMTADGVAANVMVGIGETYLPAFVLAISSSQIACGLASTVPMLIGAALQLCAPWAVRRLGSYRRWVVLTAIVQAVGFLPLVATAILGAMSVPTLFLIIAVYWAAGLGGGAAWNAWAGTLVPERMRPGYFAWRTRFAQLGILLGLAGGGVILQVGYGANWLPEAFAVLFFVAALSRMFSAYFLSQQGEPAPPSHPRLPAAGELFDAARRNSQFRVILYMLAAQAACQIAGPYFNPYMLGQLKLSYVHYLILICMPYVVKVACVPAWGRLVDRLGAHRVLWLSGLAVAPLPILWNVSDSFGYLVLVQIGAGLTWAGYELAQLLLFFDTIPIHRRVGIMTLFNLFNAVAIFAGSIIGGAVLAWVGPGRDAYWMLFIISTSGRLAAGLLLVRLPAWFGRRSVVETAHGVRLLREQPNCLRLDRQHGPAVPVPRFAVHPSAGNAMAEPVALRE